jgi:CBS domain containing-hemolysin-like protein
MNVAEFFGIVTSIVCAFFFPCFEFAYQISTKSQLEEEADRDGLSFKLLRFFIRRPAWLIATTRIGYCASLVFFSYFVTRLLLSTSENILEHPSFRLVAIIVVQIMISGLVIISTAQFLSKIAASINPYRLLIIASPPFAVLGALLLILTYPAISISKLISGYFLRIPFDSANPVFGLIDINKYFQTIYHVTHEDENLQVDKRILHNALQFKTIKVRECMIPRNEITAVEISSSIEKLQHTFLESGHSKIIVYRNSIDDIVGYCHSSGLFKLPKKIDEIMTTIIIVPETTLANELMIRFIKEKKNLAVVMDEFGGTSGIVSREDVIEEIFGEFEDEYDEDHLIEEKISEDTYLLSARLEIDYLNEKYHWQLPIGEYETLGGLILSYTEDFPSHGDTVSIPPYKLTIQATRDYRIDTIKLSPDVPGK